MKRYEAKRTGLIRIVLGITCLIPVGLLAFAPVNLFERPGALLPLLLGPALLLWLYLDTYYLVEQTQLRYRCAFLRGSIDIHRILSIRVGETMWAGVKPALATGGLIIRYNQFDELYIAPLSNDALIADLLAINPAITIFRSGAAAGTPPGHTPPYQ